MIDCSMCGHSFTQAEGAACRGGCPMAGGCGMVTCPSCGYEFPPESKLVTLVTSLLRRGPRKARSPAGPPAPAEIAAAPRGAAR